MYQSRGREEMDLRGYAWKLNEGVETSVSRDDIDMVLGVYRVLAMLLNDLPWSEGIQDAREELMRQVKKLEALR